MIGYDVAERVNAQVNNSVTYKADVLQYGRPEYWELAGAFGDCEDYALAKRGHLLSLGYSPDSLYLALCWCETGDYHCVLLVETDRGLFALDNRYLTPMPPSKLPYKWDKALRGKEWFAISF